MGGGGRKNAAFHFSPVYRQAAMFSRRLNEMTALHPFATELGREAPSFEHKLPGENQNELMGQMRTKYN